MTGAILMTILAVLCAAGTFAAVLVGKRPEEGWVAWVKDTLGSWRSDELKWTDGVQEEDAGGLGALYLMSEPGNGYTRPEEIGGPLVERLRLLREHTPKAGDHSERRPSEARA